MENKEDIKGLLKDRFATLEVDPEIDLWPAIEQEVGDDKRKGFYIWQYVAVAASLVILFTAILLLNTFSPQPQEQLANEQKEELIAPTPPQVEEYLTETNSTTENEEPLAEEKKEEISETRKQPRTQQAYQEKQPVEKKPLDEKPAVILAENGKETNVIDAIDTIQLKMVKRLATKWEVDIPNPNEPLLEIEYAALEKVPTTKPRKALDLNDLSFGKALGFASEEINKRFRSPIDIAKVRNENNEVKTFQLDIFNLSIKRKVHKQKVKKK